MGDVLRRMRFNRRFEAPRFSRWRSDPRVLVEESDGAIRDAMVQVLEEAGFEAVGCGGPDDHPGSRCPLVADGECPAAQLADVILFSLRISDPVNQAVLRALKRRHPSTPIVVEVPKPKVVALNELLVGTHPVHSPLTRRSLTRAVRDAWSSPDPLVSAVD